MKAIEDKGDIYIKLLTAFICTITLDLTGPEKEYVNTYYCSLAEYEYQPMKECLEKARKYDELQKELKQEKETKPKKQTIKKQKFLIIAICVKMKSMENVKFLTNL